MRTAGRSDERGIALLMTLLLALLVASMAVGIFLMMGNTNLIARFHASEAQMKYAADAGLELARDRLNGTVGLLPAAGVDTLETNVAVQDAQGNTIPGFTRSTYAGPSGNLTGEYGTFASVISVISNTRGAVVVRRSELLQLPFSRFARFFNTWKGAVSWGNTEVLFGPVHSNQGMNVQTGGPGTTFNGPVTVVAASIGNQSSAKFKQGVTTNATPIAFPTVATLANLQAQATTGNTVIQGDTRTTATDPDTRIEFVALDIDNDGQIGPNEGFARVFKATYPAGANATQIQNRRNFVTARQWSQVPPGMGNIGGTTPTNNADPNLFSPNCGNVTTATGVPAGVFATGAQMMEYVAGTTSSRVTAVRTAYSANGHRCYLGGDPMLYSQPGALPNGGPKWLLVDPGGHHTLPTGTPAPAPEAGGASWGQWLPWPGWGGGGPSAALVNYFAPGGGGAALITNLPGGAIVTPQQAAATLWPLSRAYNLNFKGVLHVTGSVAVSGLLRGRVTVSATGNVIFPDDITYVQPPNTTCQDILGIITQLDAVLENNNLNTPFNNKGAWTVQFDNTPDEILNSFILTLGSFQGESYSGDASVAAPENCGGKSRGCKSIIGGSIQQAIDATFVGNSGWAEQDTYDACGMTKPPPYYPTTGRYVKNRYYEIDPVGFDVATWFNNNQAP